MHLHILWLYILVYEHSTWWLLCTTHFFSSDVTRANLIRFSDRRWSGAIELPLLTQSVKSNWFNIVGLHWGTIQAYPLKKVINFPQFWKKNRVSIIPDFLIGSGGTPALVPLVSWWWVPATLTNMYSMWQMSMICLFTVICYPMSIIWVDVSLGSGLVQDIYSSNVICQLWM